MSTCPIVRVHSSNPKIWEEVGSIVHRLNERKESPAPEPGGCPLILYTLCLYVRIYLSQWDLFAEGIPLGRDVPYVPRAGLREAIGKRAAN